MTRRAPTLKMEHLVVVAGVLVGAAAGMQRLADNSMLVHLTTGIHIFNTGHIPHSDPYSFTAHGDRWIVQSWLPELIYGALWKLGGGHLFILFDMVLYGFIGGMLAYMARTGSWIRTGLVAAIGIGLGIAQWTSRPTGFALLFLVLTVFVVDRRKSAWWLVPIGVLWTNSHGSWPLGVAWIVLVGLGALLERDSVKPYARYVIALGASMFVAGLLSPAGWRILTFPLVPLSSRSAAFKIIVEWQSPNFDSREFFSGVMVLVVLLAMFAILVRHRVRWPDILPVLLFLAAALIGLRNLPLLGVILVPVLARQLQTVVTDEKPADKKFYVTSSAGGPGWILLVVLLLVGIAQPAIVLTRPAWNFAAYPVKGVDWLESQNMVGPGHQVLAPDFVGCFLILKHGENANVFIDDRYDMYPASVANDSIDLMGLDKDPQPILQKYHIESVLLPVSSRLGQYLDVNPAWTNVYSDKDWQIFQPRSA